MRFKVIAFLMIMTAYAGYSQNSAQLPEDWYMNRPIRSVDFSGLKSVAASELEAIMYPYIGRVFDEYIFWEMQGKLYALEYFDRIEPSVAPVYSPELQVIVRFNVVERPTIGRIVFNGNSGVTRRELNDVIVSKVDDIYNQSKVRLDIDAIVNKYLEKGYPNVSVTASESQARDESITLLFTIVEHEKISISRIEFQGNSRFSNNALRGQLSLKQRSIINDGAFQEAKLLADLDTIAQYYHDRGFIDAYVRDVTRTYEENSKGTNMILTFMIEEGTEFRFGGVSFEGNFIFSTEQLAGLIASRVGDIVNMTRLEMDLQRVADLYFENGYIYNTIMRTPDKNDQANTLSYTILIVERSRAYIENIIIIGNSKTRDNVILREIPLEPGDVFSRTKVMEALRNLYNLQYFSMVLPDTLQGSTENLMDLVITLEEQPTTDIQFGLTFSGSGDPDTFPISGLIQWNDTNIAGTGNQLGIELNSSIVDSTSLTINYVHRWAFGLPLSLGIDFSGNYTKKTATMDNQPPFFNGNESHAYPDGFVSFEEYRNSSKVPTRDFLMSYNQLYLSLGLSTGYRWSIVPGIFSVNGGTRFGVIRNSYDNELYRPFDPTLRDDNNTWTLKNSLWVALSLDDRDIYYDPSSGYYLYQRLGLYGLLSNEREHYIRSDTRIQYFHTLFNISVTENWSFKGVLAFNANLSLVFKQPGRDTNSLIPTMEMSNMLAVDGMFNARGWSGIYSIKGLLLLDTWVELRIPLVRGILSWDFFFDAAGIETEQGYYFGINSEGNRNFTVDNLRFSLGAGLRFTLPQFPIRLSLVKRFRFLDGDVLWQPGVLFGDGTSKGLDLVISFAISY
ncbi:MAG: outer membrane protein assembly factor BamA [Treponema sp.]|nr:outer membrane protein assembly factor BamA [Treponema sp.]